MASLGTFTFDGPAGLIEGLYRAGREGAPRAALVCHPHPEHGGSMHNKVVYHAAKAFQSLNYPVLRFNFRGVGRSHGEFGGGAGEAADVEAALDWLAAEHPSQPIVLAGFSFGGIVGLPVGAGDDRVSHLVSIGTATGRFPFQALAESAKPKLFIQGDRDEFGRLAELEDGLDVVARPWQLVVVEGGDHFLTGRLDRLQQAIVDFLSEV